MKDTKKRNRQILRSLLFLIVVATIVLLFPKGNDFNQQYELSKPWTHALLTAPFDFPVYKSREEISKEKKLLLKNYSPYFEMDTTVLSVQLYNLLGKDAANAKKLNAVRPFLEKKFQKIYGSGIVSAVVYDSLQRTGITQIMIIAPDRVVTSALLSKVYTLKTAYEEVMSNAPSGLDKAEINLFLAENLACDSISSQTAQKEMLKGFSETSGLIQKGEKIIEPGEIITFERYKILNSLKKEFNSEHNYSVKQSIWTNIGEIVVVCVIVLLFFLYLSLFRPVIFKSFRNLLFLNLLVLMIFGLAAFVTGFSSLNCYVVPFALLPIIIRVFYDSRTALFAHFCTVMLVSFMTDTPYLFIIVQVTAGMAAVSSLKDMTQRSQLAQTALFIFLTYVLMFFAIQLIIEKNIASVDFKNFIYFAISSFTLLLAYALIYIFEKMFGLLSAISLVELTNVNSDLLLRFAEAAPGSFQHSLQVSNIATEAARKIGANSLLVRTGALYHDIGKMKNPAFYIENQMGGRNPLMELPCEEAAQIIIRHVADGVAIAKRHHLPEQIVNFITTHHGKGKTKFFYNSFVNANPGIAPNDAAFSYSGPLPNSKETAILMMADAVEARLRSLTLYTEENINRHVEEMIESQIADGQFKEAPISFRDVELVKGVFKEKFKSIYHTRIEYPIKK